MNLSSVNISSEKTPKRALILFTSHPVKEALRKNLGKNIPETQAIYRAFLRHILGVATTAAQTLPFDIVVASDAHDEANINQTISSLPGCQHSFFIAHRYKSFDAKLTDAFKRVSRQGYEQIAVIGNDCLDLTPEMLCQAFQHLDTTDFSIGPAKDGGFYLLALKSFQKALFEDVHWCCDRVFAQIQANIEKLGKSFTLLPDLCDIDDRTDLTNWLLKNDSAKLALARILLALTHAAQIYSIDYHPPFLLKPHIDKRIWQKPPPNHFFHY